MISDFLLIFVLILLNGFFAAAEIAVVSARETRLQTQAEAGDARAAQALQLHLVSAFTLAVTNPP